MSQEPRKRTERKVLVLGGGISGIQASIDLANLGFKVTLVEREPSLGGRMAQLDKTFPTNDCSMCILAPKMIECFEHENIEIFTHSEVLRIEGKPGGFKVKILKKSRRIVEAKCTGCGDCAKVCPVELPSEFDQGLSNRNAIYKPFPQAVPNIYLVDRRGSSPCTAACPAGIEAHGYVALISKGKFREALALIRKRIPFSGVCGRICPHPCESECNRKHVDEPVSIRMLKRFVADFEKEGEAELPEVKERRPEKVAVIGAGPAGLTAAYHLALEGYRVTVFEALPRPGGMLAVGVPDFRLPREILNREIDLVRKLGVTIKTNTRLGKDITLRQIRKQGFKAIFVAIGAHADLPLHIPGEDLKGVYPAIDFLRAVHFGKKIKASGKMVVIGGGNAAIDSARTGLRLGFCEVTILYRRTRNEMPAYPEEIAAALEEGIRILYLAAPVEILGKRGKVKGVRCIRMALGEPDASGRRRPIPIEGSEFLVEADAVIPAIGQKVKLDFSPEEAMFDVSANGTIVADPETQATKSPFIFAGGDAATGPANAVDAMGAGIRAAFSIDRYLRGEAIRFAAAQETVIRYEDLAPKKVEKRERVKAPVLPSEARAASFEEVEKGLAAGEAVSEAGRCLNCAGCSLCLECVKACEASAIDHGLSETHITLRVDSCVIATGYTPFDVSTLAEYGYGKIKNVVTALQFERMLSASGPTGGSLKKPADGRAPKRIGFIQCVGSRDVRHLKYCSAVCCMHATKEAILAREHDPEVRSKIFYMDLRAFGKGFQEYVKRAEREYGVEYIRARPGRITENPDTLNPILWYEDTARREIAREELDLIVLCPAMSSRENNEKICGIVSGLELDEYGFIKIPDVLGRPVDTTEPGIFACGYCQAPQDIPDSVVQSSSAASRVAELLHGNCREPR